MKWFIAILCIVAGLLLIAAYMPPLEQSRGEARRLQSQINLTKIALALLTYQAQHESLPPAIVSDAEGQPIYSWRVLILPQLGEHELYEEFQLDKSWDDPANLPLVAKMPEVFHSPHDEHSAGDGYSAYRVLLEEGPRQTYFLRDRGRVLGDESVTDGRAATAMVVENLHESVVWTQPEELSPQEFLNDMKLASDRYPWLQLVTADGGTVLLEEPTEEDLVPYLYANDGKKP